MSSQEIATTDVLIIGGGPAGTATALALLAYSDLRVTVVERTAYDTLRVGEHVSPSLFELLGYLQVKDAFLHESSLPVYRTLSAWGSSHLHSRDSLFSEIGETHQLDRGQFDLFLAEQVSEKGGTILPQTKWRSCHQVDNSKWHIGLTHQSGKQISIEARFLVDATGRSAHLSRHLNASFHRDDSLVGVGAFLHFEKTDSPRQQILLETRPEGWWYSAVLPDQRIALVLFTDAALVAQYGASKAEGWNDLLSQTVHMKKLAHGGIAYNKPWVRNAHSHVMLDSQMRNWLAVGDAVSAYDPISSMGIGFALTSACHGAQAIVSQFEGDEQSCVVYQKDIQRNFTNYLKLRQQYYQLERRWADEPFWRYHQATSTFQMKT